MLVDVKGRQDPQPTAPARQQLQRRGDTGQQPTDLQLEVTVAEHNLNLGLPATVGFRAFQTTTWDYQYPGSSGTRGNLTGDSLTSFFI